MAQFRGFIGANFESIKHELEELNLRRGGPRNSEEYANDSGHKSCMLTSGLTRD